MLTHTGVMLDFEADRADTQHDWLAQFVQRAARRAGELRCGITGHNVLIRHAPTRLSLQCTTCGYESPGWELERTRERTPVLASELERVQRLRPATRMGPPVAA